MCRALGDAGARACLTIVGDLLLPPAPRALRSPTPTWWFHPLGIEAKRARTLIEVARHADKLWGWSRSGSATVVRQAGSAAGRRAVDRRASVLGPALGDPDAVPVGDFHFPNIVAWNLAGEARADDAADARTARAVPRPARPRAARDRVAWTVAARRSDRAGERSRSIRCARSSPVTARSVTPTTLSAVVVRSVASEGPFGLFADRLLTPRTPGPSDSVPASNTVAFVCRRASQVPSPAAAGRDGAHRRVGVAQRMRRHRPHDPMLLRSSPCRSSASCRAWSARSASPTSGRRGPTRRRPDRRHDPPARVRAPHHDCQVLVIGSGAGGATTAALLAEAGLDVLVVEEGGVGRAGHRSCRSRSSRWTVSTGRAASPSPSDGHRSPTPRVAVPAAAPRSTAASTGGRPTTRSSGGGA